MMPWISIRRQWVNDDDAEGSTFWLFGDVPGLALVTAEVWDEAEGLAATRLLADVGPVPSMHSDMLRPRPRPLEAHLAPLPWTFQRPIIEMNSLVVNQVLVREELLPAPLRRADIPLVQRQILFWSETHGAAFKIARKFVPFLTVVRRIAPFLWLFWRRRGVVLLLDRPRDRPPPSLRSLSLPWPGKYLCRRHFRGRNSGFLGIRLLLRGGELLPLCSCRRIALLLILRHLCNSSFYFIVVVFVVIFFLKDCEIASKERMNLARHPDLPAPFSSDRNPLLLAEALAMVFGKVIRRIFCFAAAKNFIYNGIIRKLLVV